MQIKQCSQARAPSTLSMSVWNYPQTMRTTWEDANKQLPNHLWVQAGVLFSTSLSICPAWLMPGKLEPIIWKQITGCRGLDHANDSTPQRGGRLYGQGLQ